MNPDAIPEDFPRRTGALPGAQDKFLALKVGGRYVVLGSDEDRSERCGYCAALADDLRDYCLRKACEHPSWTHLANFERTCQGIYGEAGKDWEITSLEREWLVQRLRYLLIQKGWDDLGAA